MTDALTQDLEELHATKASQAPSRREDAHRAAEDIKNICVQADGEKDISTVIGACVLKISSRIKSALPFRARRACIFKRRRWTGSRPVAYSSHPIQIFELAKTAVLEGLEEFIPILGQRVIPYMKEIKVRAIAFSLLISRTRA